MLRLTFRTCQYEDKPLIKPSYTNQFAKVPPSSTVITSEESTNSSAKLGGIIDLSVLQFKETWIREPLVSDLDSLIEFGALTETHQKSSLSVKNNIIQFYPSQIPHRIRNYPDLKLKENFDYMSFVDLIKNFKLRNSERKCSIVGFVDEVQNIFTPKIMEYKLVNENLLSSCTDFKNNLYFDAFGIIVPLKIHNFVRVDHKLSNCYLEDEYIFSRSYFEDIIKTCHEDLTSIKFENIENQLLISRNAIAKSGCDKICANLTLEANYVHFDRYFFSKNRVINSNKIPWYNDEPLLYISYGKSSCDFSISYADLQSETISNQNQIDQTLLKTRGSIIYYQILTNTFYVPYDPLPFKNRLKTTNTVNSTNSPTSKNRSVLSRLLDISTLHMHIPSLPCVDESYLNDSYDNSNKDTKVSKSYITYTLEMLDETDLKLLLLPPIVTSFIPILKTSEMIKSKTKAMALLPIASTNYQQFNNLEHPQNKLYNFDKFFTMIENLSLIPSLTKEVTNKNTRILNEDTKRKQIIDIQDKNTNSIHINDNFRTVTSKQKTNQTVDAYNDEDDDNSNIFGKNKKLSRLCSEINLSNYNSEMISNKRTKLNGMSSSPSTSPPPPQLLPSTISLIEDDEVRFISDTSNSNILEMEVINNESNEIGKSFEVDLDSMVASYIGTHVYQQGGAPENSILTFFKGGEKVINYREANVHTTTTTEDKAVDLQVESMSNQYQNISPKLVSSTSHRIDGIQVLVSEEVVETFPAMIRALGGHCPRIRCVDCQLQRPLDVIVDDVTAVSILKSDAVIDKVVLKEFLRGLTKLVFKFKKLWIVIVEDSDIVEENLSTESFISLCQSLSEFPCKVIIRQIKLVFLHKMICIIAEQSANEICIEHDLLLTDYLYRPFLNSVSNSSFSNHCNFLQLFPVINYYVAARLLSQRKLQQLSQMTSKELKDILPLCNEDTLTILHDLLNVNISFLTRRPNSGYDTKLKPTISDIPNNSNHNINSYEKIVNKSKDRMISTPSATVRKNILTYVGDKNKSNCNNKNDIETDQNIPMIYNRKRKIEKGFDQEDLNNYNIPKDMSEYFADDRNHLKLSVPDDSKPSTNNSDKRPITFNEKNQYNEKHSQYNTYHNQDYYQDINNDHSPLPLPRLPKSQSLLNREMSRGGGDYQICINNKRVSRNYFDQPNEVEYIDTGRTRKRSNDSLTDKNKNPHITKNDGKNCLNYSSSQKSNNVENSSFFTKNSPSKVFFSNKRECNKNISPNNFNGNKSGIFPSDTYDYSNQDIYNKNNIYDNSPLNIDSPYHNLRTKLFDDQGNINNIKDSDDEYLTNHQLNKSKQVASEVNNNLTEQQNINNGTRYNNHRRQLANDFSSNEHTEVKANNNNNALRDSMLLKTAIPYNHDTRIQTDLHYRKENMRYQSC